MIDMVFKLEFLDKKASSWVRVFLYGVDDATVRVPLSWWMDGPHGQPSEGTLQARRLPPRGRQFYHVDTGLLLFEVSI